MGDVIAFIVIVGAPIGALAYIAYNVFNEGN